VARKSNIGDEVIKSSDSDKSDKNLLWDVFDIQKPEWFVKKDSLQDKGVSHLPIQSPARQEEGH
jgi:hypothetical protein